MHRAAIFLVALVLCGAGPLSGQDEERQPAHVYEAYYRISQADMDEWNQSYWEHSVPVLESLVEDGIIQGWSHWQHHTGGEYNARIAIRAYDWASFDTFWREYLERLRERMPDEEWTAGSRMIIEHRDEIWDIGQVHMPEEEPEVSYVYASTFRVNFDDMGEWNDAWNEMAAPILEEAMDERILSGWVKLNHNTGGPHNSKVLYFFESWDDIDDLFQHMFQRMEEESPGEMDRVGGLFQAHDDVIWVPATRPEM